LRVLLDEHLSKDIAADLRRRGTNVEAVTERADLIGSSDSELIEVATAEGVLW